MDGLFKGGMPSSRHQLVSWKIPKMRAVEAFRGVKEADCIACWSRIPPSGTQRLEAVIGHRKVMIAFG